MNRTPDSGAEISAIGTTMTRRMGVDRSSIIPATQRLYGADGPELRCAGTLECVLRLVTSPVTAAVSVGMGALCCPGPTALP